MARYLFGRPTPLIEWIIFVLSVKAPAVDNKSSTECIVLEKSSQKVLPPAGSWQCYYFL
jgi:hypothetical protein